ncbi:hypothetical protein [uncultured Bacteroides sp.]|uniref:hypothetical protein n=1 Tax=uncultured Bacteroides sp. TaxID=162156 RepID=UPI002AAC2100|nr:hypothetical protein [uncultured Bacteroides sp.]
MEGNISEFRVKAYGKANLKLFYNPGMCTRYFPFREKTAPFVEGWFCFTVFATTYAILPCFIWHRLLYSSLEHAFAPDTECVRSVSK